MSAATGRPVPAAALERARGWLALVEYGVSADAISEREGIARSQVYHWLKVARGDGGGLSVVSAGTPAGTPAAGVPAGNVGQYAGFPAGKRVRRELTRLPARTLLYRAWFAECAIKLFRGLGDAGRVFWRDAVMEISEAGDGIELPWGGPDDLYRSRDHFLSCMGRSDAELETLVDGNLLVALPAGGIALPHRFGLRPRERLGGGVPAASVPRQGSILYPIDGGLASGQSGLNPDFSAGQSGLNPDSLAADFGGQTGFRPDSSGVARAAAAAASSQGYQSSSSSSSIESRAGESPAESGFPSGFSSGSESGRNPESAAGVVLAGLTAELLGVARINRAATADELATVQAWVRDGASRETIRAVVETVMTRPGSKPASLAYFDKPTRQTLASGLRPSSGAAPAVSSAPVAPALSAEDQVVADRLQPLHSYWLTHARTPSPPSLDVYRAARAAGRAPAMDRWLSLLESWGAAGHPPEIRLPVYADYPGDPRAWEAGARDRWDDDMDYVEEELRERAAGDGGALQAAV